MVIELKKITAGLSESINDLRAENEKIKQQNDRLQSEILMISGTDKGTEIAQSINNRLGTLEDKVGAIKISGALMGVAQSSANRKSNDSVQANDVRDDSAATVFNRFGQNSGDRTIGAGAFDMYLEAKVLEKTRVYVNFEANSANQPIAPTLFAPNGNAGFSTHLSDENLDVLNVLELYAESVWYDQRLTTTIGKIDLTNYFDGNQIAWDEHRQFLAGAFVDNLTFVSVVPANTIGVRATLDLGWGFTAQIAGVKQQNSGDKLFNEWFGIAELDYQTFFFFGKEGNYRAYSYVVEVPDTLDDRGVFTGNGGNPMGVGLSMDQKLTDKLTAFSRLGWNEDSLSRSIEAVTQAYSFGGQYQGLLPNRPEDIFGGAFGFANVANPPGATPVRDHKEYVMEFYYEYQVKDNFHISPVLQFVLHPNGDDDENWTAIFGARAFLEF